MWSAYRKIQVYRARPILNRVPKTGLDSVSLRQIAFCGNDLGQAVPGMLSFT